MEKNQLLLLKGKDIRQLLHGQEAAMMRAVGAAYKAHAQAQTAMPPDSYLRFPGLEKERIISKAAYLGGDFSIAGIKWIASFPGNLAHGMERASATMILNAIETGRPLAILEGSLISAKRTAASAALGAQQLCPQEAVSEVGLIGCGLINFETLRFLLAAYPMLETIHVFDLNEERAQQFAERGSTLKAGLNFEKERTVEAVLGAAPILSIATTAVTPHINSLAVCQPQAVVLHISLRDFSEEVILQADNVVDDIEKVCSNNTSLHLAEQQIGDRSFIRAAIGDLLLGAAPSRDADKPFSIYSPFGLGILDLALAHLVYQRAQAEKIGTVIEDFLPQSWLNS